MIEEIYKQDPPFCIKIEFTEGCNLACNFCGINGIREKSGGPYKWLTIEDAGLIATRISNAIKDHKWNPRIEFTMRGEPTMNPNYIHIVGIFHEVLPKTQLMLTSNGAGLMKKPGPISNLNALFENGLNIFALDMYDHATYIHRLIQLIKDGIDLLPKVYEYPEDPDGNPHSRRHKGKHVLTMMQDISRTKQGTHAKSMLSNHCGAAGKLNNSMMGKRCARPFRELAIRYNGEIALCCNDWRGVFRIGSTLDSELIDIWNSPELSSMRKKLYHGERDLGPCNGCDSVSLRVGLLPDKFGKETLPKANRNDYKVIEKAISGPPMTTPVYRPWEKQSL
jgi:MoaA/NifB/PqqE/SkfB family radical SAM enzyme